MAHILFTPAFEGDEYHAPGFSVTKEGEVEVDDTRAKYLVETFGNRFSTVEGKDAPVAKETTQEVTEETKTNDSAQETAQDAPVEESKADTKPAKKGKK